MAAPCGTTMLQQLRPRGGATAMTQHAVAPCDITDSGATGSGATGGSTMGGGTMGGSTTSGGTMDSGARVAAQGRQRHDAWWCSGGTMGSSSDATVAA